MIKCIQCQYRHGGCSHDWNNEVQDNCKEFKIGGCYSCNITMVRMVNLLSRKQISGLNVDARYGVHHPCGVVRENGCQESGRRD